MKHMISDQCKSNVVIEGGYRNQRIKSVFLYVIFNLYIYIYNI